MCNTVSCDNCGELIYEDTAAILDNLDTHAFCCLECFKEWHGYREVIVDTYHNDHLNWKGSEGEDDNV